MLRRAAVLGLAGGLVAAAGCRSACGDRGLLAGFGHRSAPCSLTGRSVEACPDDVPGIPVSGGGIGGTFVPGSTGAAGATELPPPAGFIPPTAVPVAPPTAAPADPVMGTLPPPKVGTPVKNGN